MIHRTLWLPMATAAKSGCSAVGSAPALGAGCREFESLHSDQNFWECSLNTPKNLKFLYGGLAQLVRALA